MKKKDIVWAAVLLLFLAAAVLLEKRAADLERRAAGDFEPAEVIRVIDGDTLLAEIEGKSCKVRLIGVNCEESVSWNTEENTEKGEEASEYVKGLLPEGSRVWLQRDVSETDRYGRLLRYVWLELPESPEEYGEVREKMLNGILVDRGLAEPRDYPPDTLYSDIFWKISGRERGE